MRTATDARDELQTLTAALLRGERAAWGRLYRLTHLPLLRWLQRRVRDVSRAEELLQATFVTAIERIDRFDPARGTIDGWLAGIARYKALELGRERRLGALPEEPPSYPAARADGVDGELIALALDALEPRYAEVLRRKYLTGQNLEEIARELGLRPATVGTWLHRGRHQFREVYRRLEARQGAIR